MQLPPFDSLNGGSPPDLSPSGIDWPVWLKAAAGILAAMWGHIPAMFQLLLVLMCLDVAAGVLRALREGRANRSSTTRSVIVKLGVVIALAVVVVLDRNHIVPLPIADFAAGWFSIHEGLSSLKNLRALGVPMPAPLVAALERWKSQSEDALKQ